MSCNVRSEPSQWALRMVQCPCCSLFKEQRFFIDTTTFARNTLCNDCTDAYRRSFSGNYSLQSINSVTVISQLKKEKKEKKISIKHDSNIVVPQSHWVAVKVKRSSKQTEFVTATLVHHRLYSS